MIIGTVGFCIIGWLIGAGLRRHFGGGGTAGAPSMAPKKVAEPKIQAKVSNSVDVTGLEDDRCELCLLWKVSSIQYPVCKIVQNSKKNGVVCPTMRDSSRNVLRIEINKRS